MAARLGMSCVLALVWRSRARRSQARVYESRYRLERYSRTLEGNLLPKFRFQLGQVEGGDTGVALGGGTGTAEPFEPDDTCPESVFEGASRDLRGPQLPYLEQDEWTCGRQGGYEARSVVLENAYLKVSIIPEWGGRLWQVYDKVRGRDWVYANPAHQPANIAVLKAWTSGGIEFNWSPGIVGHSVFSESPVYVGRLDAGERLGAAVRVWDYDRRNQTAWSVDVALDGDALYVRPRVQTGRKDRRVEGYWWTCVAVPATPDTRVFAEYNAVAQTSVEPIRRAPWPFFSVGDANSTFSGYRHQRFTDNSYLGAIPSGDFFFVDEFGGQMYDDDDQRRRRVFFSPKSSSKTNWTVLAASKPNDPFVPMHVHDGSGTKFFTWGQSGSGRFMQDFLGGVSGTNDTSRATDYAELQTGRAPTQFQTFPVVGEAAWTEVFVAADGDARVLFGPDYHAAVDHVADLARSTLPSMTRVETAALLADLADADVVDVVANGSAWAVVDDTVGGFKGLSFHVDPTYADEVRPWLELRDSGAFSDASLSRAPLSYQISPAWIRSLEISTQDSWLRDLHLAVAYAELGDVDEPKRLLARSLSARPSAVAARCLAVLQPDAQAAWPYFQMAWDIALNDRLEPARRRLLRNLATEISYFLQGLQDATSYARLQNFTARLPVFLRRADAVLTSEIALDLYLRNDVDAAIARLSDPSPDGCFPTFASARTTLMDWWFQAVERRAAARTPLDRHRARIQNPVPRNIGCPYNDYGAAGCTYW